MAVYKCITSKWMIVFTITILSVNVVDGQGFPATNSMSGLAQMLRQQSILNPNSTIGTTLSGLQTLLSRPAVGDVLGRVTELMFNGFDEYIDHHNYTIRPACLRHVDMTFGALMQGERWARRMIDAMGKPPSDLLDLHLTWLGSYEECIATTAVIYTDPAAKANPSVPFTGRYCKAIYGLTGDQAGGGIFGIRLTVGLCVPNSCDASDTKQLASILMSLVPVNTSTLPEPQVTCQLESLEYTGKAIAVITVAALFIAIIIAATVYDVVISHFLVGDTNKVKPHTKYELTLDAKAAKPKDTPVCITLTRLESNGDMKNDSTTNNGAIDKEKPDTLPTVVDHEDNIETDTSYTPGMAGKLLISFSLYTNLGKILNTRQPSGTLGAVHGIRFISMTWVILGHTFSSGLAVYEQHIVLFMPELYRRLTFQAVGNATFSVDTFFTLSGLLVAYLSLKELKKVGGIRKFKWGMFYFHRYWRLTPPYMLVLMIYVPTIKYWTNGPLWDQTGMGKDECRDTWWWNMLYINNLIEPAKQCMGWGWYLANDMQFYVVSPLLLIPLFYSRVWGSIVCLFFILGNFVASSIVTSHYDLSPNLVFDIAWTPDILFDLLTTVNVSVTVTGEMGIWGFATSVDAGTMLTALGAVSLNFVRLKCSNAAGYDVLYVKPYCRIGPYAVGVFTGYLLYKSNCKLRMRRVVALLGWTLATVVALLVLYGLWNSSGNGTPTLNRGATIVYNATSRTAWGMVVCWVVVACVTGYAGPINKFLSWPAFIPLSRLSYCAYLVHPLILNIYNGHARSLLYYTDIEMAYRFLGTTVISYAAALLVSLAFEAPMMGLEKAILGRYKRS